jgi:hypothetical protein
MALARPGRDVQASRLVAICVSAGRAPAAFETAGRCALPLDTAWRR